MKKRIVRNDPQDPDSRVRFTVIDMASEDGTTDTPRSEDAKE